MIEGEEINHSPTIGHEKKMKSPHPRGGSRGAVPSHTTSPTLGRWLASFCRCDVEPRCSAPYCNYNFSCFFVFIIVYHWFGLPIVPDDDNSSRDYQAATAPLLNYPCPYSQSVLSGREYFYYMYVCRVGRCFVGFFPQCRSTCFSSHLVRIPRPRWHTHTHFMESF